MNRCKHCGKEIDNKHKFCSRSCSAKYNNVRRQRKPWSEEQRIQNKRSKKQYYCKHCGKLLDRKKGEWTVCVECKKYVSFQSLPKRMGIEDGSLQSRYEKAVQRLIEMYQKGNSVIAISEQLHIPKETIYYNLYLTGEIRSQTEAHRVAIISGRRKSIPSNKRYFHGKHISWENEEIHYRSSYELKYAQQLDEQKVRYEVESKRIMYYDTVQQKERVAIPDFYLPDTNELIEIKSSWTYNEQNMKDKFKAYRDSGYNPILILEGKRMTF